MSNTKCPICSTQNAPDATTCKQCGFSLSLSGTLWPDSDPDDILEEQDTPPAAKAQAVEATLPPPEPAPPKQEAVKTVDHDALARTHISKGFQAVRAKSYRQARREFERARDLTQDPAIANMAQTQLDELDKAQEQARPKPAPRPAPAPKPTTSPVEALDWMAAAHVGLIISLIGGILSVCGAAFYVGIVITPVCGFIAGWWTARQAEREARPTLISHGLIAGAVVSLGGWLAQMIGYVIWMRMVPEIEFSTSTFICVSCMCGTIYTTLTIPLSALGWKLKMRRN